MFSVYQTLKYQSKCQMFVSSFFIRENGVEGNKFTCSLHFCGMISSAWSITKKKIETQDPDASLSTSMGGTFCTLGAGSAQ